MSTKHDSRVAAPTPPLTIVAELREALATFRARDGESSLTSYGAYHVNKLLAAVERAIERDDEARVAALTPETPSHAYLIAEFERLRGAPVFPVVYWAWMEMAVRLLAEAAPPRT